MGCIISVCPYRMTRRVNESSGVYFLYFPTESQADPMSPGAQQILLYIWYTRVLNPMHAP